MLIRGPLSKFSEFNCQIDRIVGIVSPEAISSYKQLVNIDLHAIFMDKENFLDRMIFGSKDRIITEESLITLLVLGNRNS